MNYPLPENIEMRIELKHSLILKRSDGITEIRCPDDFTYELEHVLENHKILKEISFGRKLLMLSFTERYTSISSEARTYLQSGPHKDFIAAEAFLIHSLPQRLLAQFYVNVSRPAVPANYFAYSDKEAAEKWLFWYQET
jgi:hypothetical protein